MLLYHFTNLNHRQTINSNQTSRNVSHSVGKSKATGRPRSGAGLGVGMLMGAGDPLLDFFVFRDLSRFHHRKVPFGGNKLGGADSFGPKKS